MGYILFVPLGDDFGDWATPKKSTAGHFFLRPPLFLQPQCDSTTTEEALRKAQLRYQYWLSRVLADHDRAYYEAQLLLIERLLEILQASTLPDPYV